VRWGRGRLRAAWARTDAGLLLLLAYVAAAGVFTLIWFLTYSR
jgi:hypothetical protein